MALHILLTPQTGKRQHFQTMNSGEKKKREKVTKEGHCTLSFIYLFLYFIYQNSESRARQIFPAV